VGERPHRDRSPRLCRHHRSRTSHTILVAPPALSLVHGLSPTGSATSSALKSRNRRDFSYERRQRKSVSWADRSMSISAAPAVAAGEADSQLSVDDLDDLRIRGIRPLVPSACLIEDIQCEPAVYETVTAARQQLSRCVGTVPCVSRVSPFSLPLSLSQQQHTCTCAHAHMRAPGADARKHAAYPIPT
jgi:hypothetical protein